MQKLIIEHTTDSQVELEIGNEITNRLGEGWLNKMVVKLENGVEVIYSLLDDKENQAIIDVHKSYDLNVFCVESCDKFIHDIYCNNQLEDFLSEFEDFGTDGFKQSLIACLSVDTVLDKMLTLGTSSLTKNDLAVIANA